MNSPKILKNNVLSLFAAGAALLSANKANADWGITFRLPIVITPQPTYVVTPPPPPPPAVVNVTPPVVAQPVAVQGAPVSQEAVNIVATTVGVQTPFYWIGKGFSQAYVPATGENIGLEWQLGNPAVVVKAYNLNDPISKNQYQDAVYNASVENSAVANSGAVFETLGYGYPYGFNRWAFRCDAFIGVGFFITFGHDDHCRERYGRVEPRVVVVENDVQVAARHNSVEYKQVQQQVNQQRIVEQRVVEQRQSVQPKQLNEAPQVRAQAQDASRPEVQTRQFEAVPAQRPQTEAAQVRTDFNARPGSSAVPTVPTRSVSVPSNAAAKKYNH